MLNISTETLQRALELRKKIEALQAEFESLMSGKTAPAATKKATPSKPSGASPSASSKATNAKNEKSGKRVSPLKGKKRSESPSGPLSPAVIKVLERADGPLKIDAIWDGLVQDGYIWNVEEPKKNLAARIYKLQGVYKSSPGFFDLKSRQSDQQQPDHQEPQHEQHHHEHHHG